jgi:hypothetical protein
MANIFQDIENIGLDVASWFKKAPQEAQDILTASNKFLNTIKVLSTSAPAQTILDLAEAFFPAITGVVSGAESILSQLIGITAQTPGQLLLQASQKAASLTGAAQVAAYNNIATAIASAANDASNGTLTAQQIVSVIQLVHNPSTLGITAPVAPTSPIQAPQSGAEVPNEATS